MNVRKLIWPFGFYFLIFAGVASYRPYMVLYYQSLSFTGTQIGLLTGIAPLLPLVTLPLITGLADRTNKHKLIMGLAVLGLVLGLILFPCLKIFIPLLVLAILLTVFFSACRVSGEQCFDVHVGREAGFIRPYSPRWHHCRDTDFVFCQSVYSAI